MLYEIKMKSKKSIIIGLINLAFVATSVLVFFSTHAGQRNVIIVPFFFYCASSFVPSIIGIFLSISAIIAKEPLFYAFVGVILNLGYLLLYCFYIYRMWPAFMGI